MSIESVMPSSHLILCHPLVLLPLIPPSFRVQLSHPYMTTGKTIALTRRMFVGKVMSLLLNTLSRLVITFLPRSKRLLISWLVTGKFGLGIWNEAGQRLIEFCQENALVIANTLFQQHKRRLVLDITRWSTPKSD